jgi:hypothetical protein
VAEHDDDLPAPAVDDHVIALAHAAIRVRQTRHERGIVVAALAQALQRLGADAVAAIVLDHPSALPGCARDHRGLILRLRAPELHAPPLREPAGVSEVIRMEVRGDHARDRLAAELVGEDALPERARVGQSEARVDDGDAVAVAVVEQPQVDVVQRERKRHTKPADARRDGGGGPGRGSLRPGMLESGHSVIVPSERCSRRS